MTAATAAQLRDQIAQARSRLEELDWQIAFLQDLAEKALDRLSEAAPDQQGGLRREYQALASAADVFEREHAHGFKLRLGEEIARCQAQLTNLEAAG